MMRLNSYENDLRKAGHSLLNSKRDAVIAVMKTSRRVFCKKYTPP